MGHCFVCDGYEDGYYHINWGIDGYYDVFYKLTALKLNEYYNFSNIGYDLIPSLSHGAVINIKPNRSEETGLKDVTADADEDIVIYDLFGTAVYSGDPSDVPALRSGIYIIQSDRSVRTVIIRLGD